MSIVKIALGVTSFALGVSTSFAGTDFSGYVTEGALAAPGTNGTSGADKVWTWGYVIDRKPSFCPFVDGRTSWSLEDEVAFLGARRHAFYMNSMFNRKFVRKYFPDWNEECFTNCIDSALSDAHFAKLSSVGEIWCAVEHGNRFASAVEITKLSLRHPQIAGLNFDDFNNGLPETAITADDFAKLRRTVGPDKTILQGIYIRDYGTSDMKAPRAMPIDLFRKSVRTVRDALRDGTIDGVLVPQAGWFGSSEHREHIACLREFLGQP